MYKGFFPPFILKCLKTIRSQEIMKVREVIPHTGPIPIVILFLDLLRDPAFPRGLTDSQSHVLIFTNVDS